MSGTSKPYLILISGPPGAGKSTFTKPIVTELRGTWLEIDCIGDPFSMIRDQNYTDNIEPQAIQGLLNLARLNLSAQQTVIMDLPWKHLLINTPEWIIKIQDLIAKTNAVLVVFECYLSETALRHRITARNAYRDLDKIESDAAWQNFLKHIHFQDKNPLPHILINTEDSTQNNFDLAKQYLSEKKHMAILS